MKKITILLCFLWFTTAAKSQHLFLDQWKYILIDSARTKWGDYGSPEWLRYFGLDAGDADHDGDQDLVAGRTLYLNPGGSMENLWQRKDLGQNVDGIFIMNVDGDPLTDVIAMALPDIFWFEAKDNTLDQWEIRKISSVPPTSHVNSQGFRKAQLVSGGPEELLIASEKDIYSIEIPADPSLPWKTILIGENTSDEGIGTGDIDGDGDIDIAAGRRAAGSMEPMVLAWFQNPGFITGPWKSFEAGTTNHPIDRIEIADINGDHKPDFVIAEERWPGLEPDGNLFWFEQPIEDTSGNWNRHRVVTQYSMNNLDLADLDHDGDQDIVTNEHKGPNHETQVWENDGKGNFSKIIIDTGKEGHLGTRLFDLDNDGDLDLVSPAWDNYKNLHTWRNDAINPYQVQWKHYSTESGDLPVPNKGKEQTSCLVMDIDKDGINDFVITERTQAPSASWYKFKNDKWEKYILDTEPLFIEAGSSHADIDRDGDEDFVAGGDYRSNQVWWWENPYPDFNPAKPWARRLIKSGGGAKHHDSLFGDFDGDGKDELAFWCQGDHAIYMAEIPAEPKKAKAWEIKMIYQYHDDSQMEQRGQDKYPSWKGNNEHEGLYRADIDGDGVMDLVAGGRWFIYDGKGGWQENIIDASYTFSRAAAGQCIEGGRPEVLLVVGDGIAPLMMYEFRKGTWFPKTLLKEVDNGHSLQIVDFNKDGHSDIFIAEMRFGDGNPDSKALLLLGDGQGNFKKILLQEGYDFHESKLADLDGDGDFDILDKPYSGGTPRLDIWLNE